jgi:hypothetical protein
MTCEGRSGEDLLRSCEFRPTSVTGEAAHKAGQLGPIPVAGQVERIKEATQFEQSRALIAC